MVPPPGTLLEPAEVEIGALVDARDDPGIWYRARVIDKTGRGARTSVTVRFQRFNQKHDRKFKKSHKAIRVRLSSAALRAEQDVTQWGGRNDGRRDDGFWEVGVGNGVSGARGRSSGSGGPEATARVPGLPVRPSREPRLAGAAKPGCADREAGAKDRLGGPGLRARVTLAPPVTSTAGPSYVCSRP